MTTPFDMTPSWAGAEAKESSWQPGQSRRLQDLFMRPQPAPAAEPSKTQGQREDEKTQSMPEQNSDVETILTIIGGR